MRSKMCLLPAALVCLVLLSACGSSGAPNGGTAKRDAGLKLAHCMRANGVPNFPDPGSGGDLEIGPGSGINPRSPAFQRAQQACRRYVPSFPVPGTMSAGQRRRALAFAECLRTHGQPDFPDPTIGTATPATTGRVLALQGMFFAVGPAINPKSPAFRQAAARCGLDLP
ncbi:MAG: hypothetical protein JO244_13395 [Solirubrobacterales bacterium]|nr:hypothetical protein [Solirubrobacterales bacterium]